MTETEKTATSRMKGDILMMCWNFPPAVGGIEAVAFNLWKELKKSDLNLHVVARYSSNTDEEVLRPGSSGLLRYLLFSFFEGRRILKQNPVSLLVCPGIVDAPVAWLLSKWFKVPFVLLAHGTDIQREGSVYRKISRSLFRASEGVAANSHNTQQLLQDIGVRPERIRVIPPGVQIPEISPERKEVPEITSMLNKQPGPVLMTVGRVIRRKGIGEFIEQVLPELLKRHPDLHYIVVGADASDSLAHQERLLDQLQERTKELGLEDHVSFTGKVSDGALHQLLSHADLLVFPVIPIPGDVEGFGIVVLEGAIHGVPTVASRIGGIPDAVEDGKSGILVEPEKWREMIEVISDLLKDESARQEMGAYAARRAKEGFSWEVIGKRYLTFFSECSRKGRR